MRPALARALRDASAILRFTYALSNLSAAAASPAFAARDNETSLSIMPSAHENGSCRNAWCASGSAAAFASLRAYWTANISMMPIPVLFDSSIAPLNTSTRRGFNTVPSSVTPPLGIPPFNAASISGDSGRTMSLRDMRPRAADGFLLGSGGRTPLSAL